jgi:hypothetical protein
MIRILDLRKQGLVYDTNSGAPQYGGHASQVGEVACNECEQSSESELLIFVPLSSKGSSEIRLP